MHYIYKLYFILNINKKIIKIIGELIEHMKFSVMKK